MQDDKNQIIDTFKDAALEARRDVFANIVKEFGSISVAITHLKAHETMATAHRESEKKKADSDAQCFEEFLRLAEDQSMAVAAMRWQEFEYANPAGAVSVQDLHYQNWVMNFSEIKVAPKSKTPGM